VEEVDDDGSSGTGGSEGKLVIKCEIRCGGGLWKVG